MVAKIKTGRKVFLMIGIMVMLSALMIAASIWVSKNTFLYSNLVDGDSKLKAQSLLLEHDIPQEDIEVFFELVNAFNCIPYRNIVESGWKKAVIPFFSYNNQNGFKHLEAQPEELTNCRVTAFILMKNNIVFGNTELTPTETKDVQSRRHLTSEDDRLHYDLLFANIETVCVDSSEKLVEEVTEYWKRAGISFSNGNVQLITVYGASKTVIQNFHTAVAIYTADHVWLLEKVDPIHPYQVSCFEDQAQMISYIKKRVSTVKSAAIFANDGCLWAK